MTKRDRKRIADEVVDRLELMRRERTEAASQRLRRRAFAVARLGVALITILAAIHGLGVL
jgi:hypothetical protein